MLSKCVLRSISVFGGDYDLLESLGRSSAPHLPRVLLSVGKGIEIQPPELVVTSRRREHDGKKQRVSSGEEEGNEDGRKRI